MKKPAAVFSAVILIICLLAAGCYFINAARPLSKKNARERVQGFINAVNDNKPEIIYDYLTPEIRSLIGKEGFVKNFAKERSYPYLTPLYLYLEELQLKDDRKTGHVKCIVASRLPGEKMEFNIVFTNNNYYIDAFKDIADGSFLEKFKKLQP